MLLAPLAEGWDGAVPGLPVADTVKRVRDGAVVETLPRGELVAVQTPQAFVAAVLRSRSRRRADATDCASLVEARGGRVEGRRGRPAAAEGDDRRGPRARRELAAPAPGPGGRRDRRLPHAPPGLGRADRPHGRGGRALRRDGGRARRRRDRVHRARLLLPRRPAAVAMPYKIERCVYDLDAVRRRDRRGEAAGAAGQARARGRLRRPAAGRAGRAARRRTRGTTCSARCTGSTGSRSTRSRDLGRARRGRGLAALLRRRSPSSPRPVTSTCSRTPTWSRSSTGGPSGSSIRRLGGARARGLDRRAAQAVGEIYPDPAMLAGRPADHARIGRARPAERGPRLRPRARARPRRRLRDGDRVRGRRAARSRSDEPRPVHRARRRIGTASATDTWRRSPVASAAGGGWNSQIPTPGGAMESGAAQAVAACGQGCSRRGR